MPNGMSPAESSQIAAGTAVLNSSGGGWPAQANLSWRVEVSYTPRNAVTNELSMGLSHRPRVEMVQKGGGAGDSGRTSMEQGLHDRDHHRGGRTVARRIGDEYRPAPRP